MKQPKLKVIPFAKKDKEQAKIMSQIINYEYKKHGEFIEAITRARMYVEGVYGLKTQDQPWDMILTVYMQQISKIKK